MISFEKRFRIVALSVADILLLPITALLGLAARFYWDKQKFMPVSRRLLRLMGVYPGRYHYYTPAVRERDLIHSTEEPRSLPAINWQLQEQLTFLSSFDFTHELDKIPTLQNLPRQYRFDYGAFPAGDADLLYGILRSVKPSKIIEIGSGSSTLLMLEAIAGNKRDDPDYRCELSCIEPYAHDWLEKTGMNIIRQRVETISPERFDSLGRNDILFIDSSHVVRAQNDVVYEYLQILPRLKSGVLVHIHDIFSPRDYPRKWLIENNNQWGEQYLVEAFLSFNKEFKVLCSANMLYHDHRKAFEAACPMLAHYERQMPSSLWLSKL